MILQLTMVPVYFVESVLNRQSNDIDNYTLMTSIFSFESYLSELLCCPYYITNLHAKIVRKIERQGKSGNNSCLRAIYRTLAK